MYIPSAFAEPDPIERERIVHDHALAILVSHHNGEFEANHLPFFLDGDSLLAHVARANPIWQTLQEGAQVMVVFRGVEGYISPNWYPSKQATHRQVPTWNYEVVHAHGTLHLQSDAKFLRRVLALLTRQHEASQAKPWRMGDAPKDYLDAQLQHIVALEVRVTRWEVKRKLSQNRDSADRLGAINTLNAQGQQALAQAMAKTKTT